MNNKKHKKQEKNLDFHSFQKVQKLYTDKKFYHRKPDKKFDLLYLVVTTASC